MNWYKTAVELLQKKSGSASQQALLCYNPDCGQPLLDPQVMYCAEQKEVYHVGNCCVAAHVYAVIKGNPVQTTLFSDIRTISLEEAMKLSRTGKLKPWSCEEKSIEQLEIIAERNSHPE